VEKKTARYVAAGTAAAIGVLLGASALVTHRADYATAKLARRANQLRQQHEQLPTRHAAAWGETVDDRAFAHYAQAIELAEAFEDDELHRLIGGDDATVAQADELRARWLPVATAVRRGAHASDRRMVRPVHRPGKIGNLLTYRRATNLTMLEARHQRAVGNHREAVRYTLDAITLGVDCVADGVLINQMIGAAATAIGAEAWQQQHLRELDAETLDEFAAGLANLDARFPSTLHLEHEMWVTASLMLGVPDAGIWNHGSAWRYGFSDRWMAAEAFLLMADSVDRLNDLRDAPWDRRKAAFEREAERMLASGNNTAEIIMPNLLSAEQSLRRTAAMLHSLRLAIDQHRDTDTPLAKK